MRCCAARVWCGQPASVLVCRCRGARAWRIGAGGKYKLSLGVGAVRLGGSGSGDSSSGRTPDSESGSPGSNPGSPAIRSPALCGRVIRRPLRLAAQDTALSRRRSRVRIPQGLPPASLGLLASLPVAGLPVSPASLGLLASLPAAGLLPARWGYWFHRGYWFSCRSCVHRWIRGFRRVRCARRRARCLRCAHCRFRRTHWCPRDRLPGGRSRW